MMMDRIALRVASLRQGVTLPNTYVLLLVEAQEGRRTLPVVINKEEAMLLIRALDIREGIHSGLLTIMHEMATQYQIAINEIILHHDDVNGFFAYLFFERDGLLKHTRTSVANAVLMAQRFGQLIYIKRELFERKHDPAGSVGKVALPLSQLGEDSLEHLLQDALEKEDYELAANIRDEIERRSTNQPQPNATQS